MCRCTSPAKAGSEWSRAYSRNRSMSFASGIHLLFPARNEFGHYFFQTELFNETEIHVRKVCEPVPKTVAQVGNLPCRRLAVGQAFGTGGACGFPIRDTADCQSALPHRLAAMALSPPPAFR